MRSDGDLVF